MEAFFGTSLSRLALCLSSAKVKGIGKIGLLCKFGADAADVCLSKKHANEELVTLSGACITGKGGYLKKTRLLCIINCASFAVIYDPLP